MNKEDKLKEYVQNTYEELHAPDGLRRKVMNMNGFNAKKMGMSVVKKLAVAAAIAAVLFAGSNGVAYAMTGSTWVETVVAKLSINGVEQDVEMQCEVLENGTKQYSTTIDVEEGDEVTLSLVTDAVENAPNYEISMEAAEIPGRTEIVVEDGIVYFIDNDVKVDITEDISDGEASGTYEKNGMVYQYEVKEEPGVPGGYELHISSEEE